MKKVFIFLGVLILLFLLYTHYENNYSREARLGKLNLSKSKNIRVGMSESQVIGIMGQPEEQDAGSKGEVVLRYSCNNIDYLDLKIYIDSSNKVSKISIPTND